MDKQKIGLIGALVIVAIALVGGIILSAKGIPVPAWLARGQGGNMASHVGALRWRRAAAFVLGNP